MPFTLQNLKCKFHGVMRSKECGDAQIVSPFLVFLKSLQTFFRIFHLTNIFCVYLLPVVYTFNFLRMRLHLSLLGTHSDVVPLHLEKSYC